MSIAKMRGDAWTYYAREVATSAEDYYLGVGEEPGWWWGAQANAWGLAGRRVDEDELRRVFAGLDPHTGEVLGRAFGDRSVNGIAAAFSAPKSVSLLWALGDEATAKEVRAAHRAAYVEALEYLQSQACLTRVGAAGRHQVDAQGFAVAVFEHRTSRLADPQLHAHALIATKVADPEGNWRSADTNEIYANVRTAGALYQSALRAELTERLGVEWGPTNGHGQADVAGVDDKLVEAFSKRRAQVQTAVEAWVAEGVCAGRLPADYEPSRADYQQATLASRPGKDRSVGPESLRGMWREEAAELGWTADRLERDVLRKTHRPPAVHERAVVEQVLASLTTNDATFAHRHVMREVASCVDAHREVVEDLAAKVLADRRAVSLAAPADPDLPPEHLRADGRPTWLHRRHDRWTTSAQLALEAKVLEYAAAPLRLGVVGEEALQAALGSRDLDVGQAAAVRQLLTSGRPVDLLVAGAGTGKSHTLAAAAAGWEAEGYRVVAMAPRGGAAAVMRAEGLAGADTVAKYLVEWGADRPLPDYELHPGDVVLVDEAGSSSTRELAAIVAEAEPKGAKVVFVGDPRQLSSVEAGGLFAYLAAEEGVATLERVHRQRQEWEREAAQALRAGDESALDTYDAHGRLHAGERAEMIDQLYSAWAADRAEGVDSLMLASRRADVAALNARAHDERVAAGEVAPGGMVVGEQAMGVGDVVLTTAPDRRQIASNGRWVLNGDRWSVNGITPSGGLAVTHLEHGGRLVLPSDYVAESVALGYAATVHRAQGTTSERCHLLADIRMLANHLYVALTRGRGENHAWVALDDVEPDHACAPAGAEHRCARDVLADVLRRPQDDAAAHTVLREQLAAEIERAAATPTPTRQWGPGRQPDALPERESAVAAAMRRRQEHERVSPALVRDVGWGR